MPLLPRLLGLHWNSRRWERERLIPFLALAGLLVALQTAHFKPLETESYSAILDSGRFLGKSWKLAEAPMGEAPPLTTALALPGVLVGAPPLLILGAMGVLGWIWLVWAAFQALSGWFSPRIVFLATIIVGLHPRLLSQAVFNPSGDFWGGGCFLMAWNALLHRRWKHWVLWMALAAGFQPCTLVFVPVSFLFIVMHTWRRPLTGKFLSVALGLGMAGVLTLHASKAKDIFWGARTMEFQPGIAGLLFVTLALFAAYDLLARRKEEPAVLTGLAFTGVFFVAMLIPVGVPDGWWYGLLPVGIAFGIGGLYRLGQRCSWFKADALSASLFFSEEAPYLLFYLLPAILPAFGPSAHTRMYGEYTTACQWLREHAAPEDAVMAWPFLPAAVLSERTVLPFLPVGASILSEDAPTPTWLIFTDFLHNEELPATEELEPVLLGEYVTLAKVKNSLRLFSGSSPCGEFDPVGRMMQAVKQRAFPVGSLSGTTLEAATFPYNLLFFAGVLLWGWLALFPIQEDSRIRFLHHVRRGAGVVLLIAAPLLISGAHEESLPPLIAPGPFLPVSATQLQECARQWDLKSLGVEGLSKEDMEELRRRLRAITMNRGAPEKVFHAHPLPRRPLSSEPKAGHTGERLPATMAYFGE